MSSHHFVKEGQEPALFILEAVSYQRIAPLLEWAPLVITVDRAVDQVLSWGIKVDVVFSSAPDIKSLQEQLYDQMPVRIIPYTAETLVQEVLVFLQAENQPSVSILTEAPASLFTMLGNQSSFHEIVLIDANTRWLLVYKGSFEKWYPADLKLDVKLTTPGQRLETNGLLKENDQFKTSQAGLVQIHSSSPFWLGESA